MFPTKAGVLAFEIWGNLGIFERDNSSARTRKRSSWTLPRVGCWTTQRWKPSITWRPSTAWEHRQKGRQEKTVKT